MAALVVVGLGAAVQASLPAGTSALTIGLVAAATAAAALGAAYIDQRYIYPKLFGTDDPRVPALQGIDVMTGQDGSPGHTCWGRQALVGGHVLWFENLDTITNQISTKKGDGVTQTKRIADVGIGWTRNLIQNINQINADQKVFWRRDPNNVFWSDWRVTFEVYADATLALSPVNLLRVVLANSSAQQFAPLFVFANAVLVTGMQPNNANGYYRAIRAVGPGSVYPYGYIDLLPQQGQNPADPTSAGDSIYPMAIRRMDSTYLGFVQTTVAASLSITLAGGTETFPPTLTPQTFCGPFGADLARTIWRPGAIWRLDNTDRPASEGRYEVTEAFWNPPGSIIQGTVRLEPIDGQAVGAIGQWGSAVLTSMASRLLLNGEEGFLQSDPLQEHVRYLGLETQDADPDLAAIYGAGNVHGYRGLARSTIRNLSLSAWGDRVPSMSAVVTVNERHTTHDVIRNLMRETFRGDDSRFDLTTLQPDLLLGYSRRGQQPTTQTLQPVAIAFAIEAQERGRAWAFFKAADADLHQLGEHDIGAYVGQFGSGDSRAFRHQRLQDRDLPRRLTFYYRDPLNSFTKTEKAQRASLPDDPTNDDVAIDVDPVVLYPWQAQDRVNELFSGAIVARDQGSIAVPPSRLDILPNDRVTFTALNWNEEDPDVSGGLIDHDTAINGIEPGSISIEVEFETAGRARLVDDQLGQLFGLPAGVTASVNAVDYDAGTIELTTSEPITDARIRYEFPNGWRMRVQRVTRQRNGVTTLALVAVAERFAVVGSPVEINHPILPPPLGGAMLVTHYLDLTGPWLWAETNPGAMYVAAPLPGSTWSGAGVYSSQDQIAYALRAVIAEPTPIGEALEVLPSGILNIVDYQHTLDVRMRYGTLESATLGQIGAGLGRNWIVVGHEIIGFLGAEQMDDLTVAAYGLSVGEVVIRLSGLIRGYRDTDDQMAGHAVGDRVVLLDFLGLAGYGGGVFEQFASGGEQGQNVWLKIVPAGGRLDDVAAQQVTFEARNVRPFRPGPIVQGDIATYGYEWSPLDPTYDPAAWLVQDIVIRWFHRSRAVRPTFGIGGGTADQGIERYQIEVWRNGAILPSRTRIIGGQNSGSARVHRTFRYTLAEQTADGWISTDEAEFRVYQIGQGGPLGYSRVGTISWTIP